MSPWSLTWAKIEFGFKQVLQKWMEDVQQQQQQLESAPPCRTAEQVLGLLPLVTLAEGPLLYTGSSKSIDYL